MNVFALLGLATKQQIEKLESKIMATLNEQLVKIKGFIDEQGESIDVLVNSVSGVAGDVTRLLEKIEELQNSPGNVTPADQALLDSIEALANTTNNKLAAVKNQVLDLDAQNVPEVSE